MYMMPVRQEERQCIVYRQETLLAQYTLKKLAHIIEY